MNGATLQEGDTNPCWMTGVTFQEGFDGQSDGQREGGTGKVEEDQAEDGSNHSLPLEA